MAITEFWEMLENDPPDWHQLQSGASDADIQATEAALSVKLPHSYQSFLRR